MSKKGSFGMLLLGVLTGIFFSSSTALAVANQIVRLDSTIHVNFSYPGGYDYNWYADDWSIVQVEGNGTGCRLTGKSLGTTTIHCQYKFNNTYYDYILERPVTDVYVQEERFSVTVTNGEVQEGETGEIVDPADCQAVKDLSCGLMPVKKNNLWGFVDRNWRLVIPFQFDDVIYIFHERSQTACVKYNGSYYAIDRTGKTYGPLSGPYEINNNFAETQHLGGGIVWQKGDGTTVNRTSIENITDVGDAFDDADVLIPGEGKNGLYGYLNRDYQWVIEPQFQTAYPFHQERAIVQMNERWCFIDRSGRAVTTLSEQFRFSKGLIQYTVNNGKGTVHFPWKSFYLSDGLCPMIDDEESENGPNFFYIDEKGEPKLTQYLWGTSFVDGMAIVVNEEGYEGVINTRNEVLIPFEYQYNYSEQCLPGGGMTYLGEGVFAFHDDFDAPYILLDSSGKRLTQESYDSVLPFENGMAQVSRGGHYGYLSPKGETLFPLTYSQLRFWGSSRYALAQKDDGSYEIVTHPLIPCPHEYLECRDAVLPSCTTDGYSGDACCTECNAIVTPGAALKATGHVWGDWNTNEKNHWKTCACGEKASYGAHTFVWIIDRAATTSSQGKRHQECSSCGLKNKEEVIDRLPGDSNSPGKNPLPDNSDSTDSNRKPDASSNQTSTGKISIKKAAVSGIKTLYYGNQSLVQKNLTVKIGKKTLKKGRDYDVSYRGNKKIGTASLTITGKGNYKDSLTKSFQIKVKEGSLFTVKGMKYQVTNQDVERQGTVMLIGTSKKKNDKRFTSLKIGNTVTIGGRKFQITAIGKRAFYGYSRLKSLSVGNQVKTLGTESFSGCSSLTRVSLGSGVTKIGDKAFFGCKRLKSLTLSSKKLKSVGKQAFQKNPKQAVLRVPSAKQKQYQKLLQKKTGFKGSVKKIK